jgi:catechol 2,3-dioxygenase-like lactoylglutathione lyase family enzyme
MFKDTPAFSGFSVDNLDDAKRFYGDKLGLEVEVTPMGLRLHLAGGNPIFVYEKADHEPASFTILNFPVSDIDAAVKDLGAAGVGLERYEGMTDEDGVARGKAADRGPDIAWFKDPAGNILSVLED